MVDDRRPMTCTSEHMVDDFIIFMILKTVHLFNVFKLRYISMSLGVYTRLGNNY